MVENGKELYVKNNPLWNYLVKRYFEDQSSNKGQTIAFENNYSEKNGKE